MNYHCESASKIFARDGKTRTFLLDEDLLPSLSTNDVIEISGESGSGKTELLYHLIVSCTFPSSWKGLNLGGLETKVMFIDNDCRFNLLRLITVMENRIKSKISTVKVQITKEEIFSFIQSTLKLLYVVKCFDSDEYIMTLHSLDNLLSMQNYLILIDGVSSFYWSDKARFQNNFPKLSQHYRRISELILKKAESSCAPIVVTRHKLLNTAENDEKVLGILWKNGISRRFRLEKKGFQPDRTNIDALDCENSIVKQCYITKLGFTVAMQSN